MHSTVLYKNKISKRCVRYDKQKKVMPNELCIWKFEPYEVFTISYRLELLEI